MIENALAEYICYLLKTNLKQQKACICFNILARGCFLTILSGFPRVVALQCLYVNNQANVGHVGF